MARSLDDLVELISRDVSHVLAPGIPSRVQVSGGWLSQLLDEPNNVAAAVAHHSAYPEAIQAAASDADLARIAPSGVAGPRLIAITGEPRVSAEELLAASIGAAAAELRRYGLEPGPDSLASEALRNLDRLRHIGRGAATDVTTFIGFSGVSLPDGQELDLPWGKLTGSIGFYGAAEVMALRPTSCVLAADHRLFIAIDDSNRAGFEVPKAITDHHEWEQLTIHLVSLAMALGTPLRRTAPIATFQLTVLPFETPISGHFQLVLAPPAVERRLEAEECAEIIRWATILKDRYSPRLEVAARRIIAAFSQRLDPADRLIDAVTAWESMFSADQEAALRVTASIAWLLQPDAGPRDALQRELSDIYKLRSSVVHGRKVDPVEVYNASQRASEVAIEALAGLLEQRPELIPDDPSVRSRRLLLGLS